MREMNPASRYFTWHYGFYGKSPRILDTNKKPQPWLRFFIAAKIRTSFRGPGPR